MPIWVFKDYVTPAGATPISKWYAGLSAPAKVKFDDLLEILSKTQNWQWPEYKVLRGKHLKGLSELRFSADKREYRVIGFFKPLCNHYVLLIGCFHKGKIYEPPSTLETALQRKVDVETGKGGLVDHEL